MFNSIYSLPFKALWLGMVALTCLQSVCAEDIYRGKFTPDADYVLSGQLAKDLGPLPPTSYTWLTEKDGYDADAYGPPPAPGVHPRVLMSPSDIVEIRKKVVMGPKAGRYFQIVWQDILNRSEKNIILDKALVALVTEDQVLGKEAVIEFMKEVDYYSCIVDILNTDEAMKDVRDSWYYYSRTSIGRVGGVPFEDAYKKGGGAHVLELAKKSVEIAGGEAWHGVTTVSRHLFNNPISNYDLNP
jgi:hypothetical protein